MEIKIRDARKKDAPALSQIAVSSKRYWKYPEQWIKLWESDLEIKPDFIEQNKVLVAVFKNTIVGFTALSFQNKSAELEHLWVLPEYVGKGIGKQLFQTVLKACGDNNIIELKIESDPNARRFYEKMGAKHVGYSRSKPAHRKLPLLILYFNKAKYRYI